LESRDVIGHVTIRLPGSTSYGWSIGTMRLSCTVMEISSNIACTDLVAKRKTEEWKEKKKGERKEKECERSEKRKKKREKKWKVKERGREMEKGKKEKGEEKR